MNENKEPGQNLNSCKISEFLGKLALSGLAFDMGRDGGELNVLGVRKKDRNYSKLTIHCVP